MRVGIALPHYDTSYEGRPAAWANVRRVAEVAEACELDSVWMSDHLFLDWSKYGGSSEPQGALEAWTTLSALAGVTHRVRLGTMALCNDLRNPALLAKMAATLDVVSEGRVELGLGAGWYEPEFRAAGIEFAPAATRIGRLREAVEIVARMLAGEELTYPGRHYAIRGALCRPEPVQRPRVPVWVGGKGDLLLRAAAAAADGWNFSWLGRVDTYRERLDAARRACDAAGRDFDTLRRSVGVYVLAGEDEGDARARFHRLVERSPAGVLNARDVGRAVSWEDFRRDRFAGTTREVVDRLGELVDLGVEEIVVALGTLPFQVADEDDLRLLGTEIAPALRR